MKQPFVVLISLYQLLLSPFLRVIVGAPMCRYSPSCSEYAKKVIADEGVFRGIRFALVRLLSCQPLRSLV